MVQARALFAGGAEAAEQGEKRVEIIRRNNF